VRETEQTYILEGELPGLNDKNNVEIEFTDHQTLLVKGRIERTLHNSNAASASEKQHTTTTRSEDKEHGAHRPQTPPRPTVEDDVDEDDKASTVIKSTEKRSPPQPQQPEKPKVRYWIAERQVGEFQRSFSFPGLIDQEGVTAKLANGVLTIEVPKRAAHVVKRIQIQ
jgi:HSP20 family molecular chaperone IbpA